MRALVILFLLVLISTGCYKPAINGNRYVIVKIPPFYNKTLTRGENFWRFQKFLFPQIEIPETQSDVLPNDDSLLVVTLDQSKSIKINTETIGSLSDSKVLTQKLKRIFIDRLNEGVYESASKKVVKAVGVRADRTAKFGDVAKILVSVRESGASPVVLLLDGHLPNMEIGKDN